MLYQTPTYVSLIFFRLLIVLFIWFSISLICIWGCLLKQRWKAELGHGTSWCPISISDYQIFSPKGKFFKLAGPHLKKLALLSSDYDWANVLFLDSLARLHRLVHYFRVRVATTWIETHAQHPAHQVMFALAAALVGSLTTSRQLPTHLHLTQNINSSTLAHHRDQHGRIGGPDWLLRYLYVGRLTTGGAPRSSNMPVVTFTAPDNPLTFLTMIEVKEAWIWDLWGAVPVYRAGEFIYIFPS